MPNAKIYVDEALLRAASAQVDTLILQTRETIIAGLGVAEEACHIVALGVRSPEGQTPVNIELCILQKPDRARAMVEQVCRQLRDLAAHVLNEPAAIRCTLNEPENYVVIRAG